MFNYATYNGVPIITYGLIGLTTSLLALVALNPSILELKEDGTQTTIANSFGLDKIQMPEFLSPSTNNDDTSYIPGINGIPQPFYSDEREDKVENEREDKVENEREDNVENESIAEQYGIYNPLRQDEKTRGGRITRNKRKKLRKTKRKTKRNK
jgi:hypothetical protein